MSITWKLEVKKLEDEKEVRFGDRQVNAETIREAVRKAEDIIMQQYPYLFSPPQDMGWVLIDEGNCIVREYRRRDYSFYTKLTPILLTPLVYRYLIQGDIRRCV